MSSKPISERQDALQELIEIIVEWQIKHASGEPMLDTKRTIYAALMFLGWREV